MTSGYPGGFSQYLEDQRVAREAEREARLAVLEAPKRKQQQEQQERADLKRQVGLLLRVNKALATDVAKLKADLRTHARSITELQRRGVRPRAVAPAARQSKRDGLDRQTDSELYS